MIWGALIRRATGPVSNAFEASRIAVMAVHKAAQGFSEANPTLAVLTVVRKAVMERARADVPLVVMSAARRRAQPSRADVPLLVIAAARRAPATATPTLASRLAVMIVH